MFGKYIDRFWAGIFLTVTVFVIIIASGYMFSFWGTPFFTIAFDMNGLASPLSWVQIAFVALLLGMSAAWLRRNSKIMRRM
ncbi:MAG: hypothetical protein FK734_09255 [Asgard group archaeon]|nr:hypothetical protein [Asgard group archaeon]